MRYANKKLKTSESQVVPGTAQVLRGYEPLITEDQAWDIVLTACADFLNPPANRKCPHLSLRLFLEGCRVDRDLASLLPGKDDINIDNYAERIQQSTNRKFFLVINHIQTINWDLYECIRYNAIGFAKIHGERAVRAALILGNDKFSAFGVHFDEGCFEQVQEVIVGNKRTYLWDRDILSEEEQRVLTNSSQFASHLDSAIVLDSSAGEAVSWSGNQYHVMENLSKYSLALTVTYRERTPGNLAHELRNLLSNVAMELADRCDPYLDEPDNIRREIVAGLPTAIGPSFMGQLVARRLCAETSGCVEHSPTPRTLSPMTPSEPFERIAQSTVRWIRWGTSILFSSCGHYYEIKQAPDWTENILETIANIDRTTIEELTVAAGISEHGYEITSQIIEALRASYAFR